MKAANGTLLLDLLQCVAGWLRSQLRPGGGSLHDLVERLLEAMLQFCVGYYEHALFVARHQLHLKEVNAFTTVRYKGKYDEDNL